MEREAPGGETPAADGTAAERRARDLAWLARMREADDTAAFEMLFDAYVVPLVKFAQRRIASRELARDIVTDVMVDVWRRRHELVLETTFAAYAYRAVSNKAAQHVRHAQLERKWLGTFAQEGLSPTIGTYALRGPEEMDRDLDRQALHAAVDALPEATRRVAILRWFEGLSHPEIAVRLRVAVVTVNYHLMAAKRRLAAQLAPHT